MLALAAVAFLTGAIVGAHRGPSASVGLAQRFTSAWARGDYAAMYSEITPAAQRRISAEAFGAAYEQALRTASATGLRVSGAVRGQSGATAAVPMTVDTSLWGPLKLTLTLPTESVGGRRLVAWNSSLVFPGMAAGATLTRSTTLPRRATLLARDGTVLAESPAEGQGGRVTPLGEETSAIVGSVGAIPSARLHALEAEGVPADAEVGISGLEESLDQRLRGTPGGELRAGGRVLAYVAPHAAGPVRTSISPAIQSAAESALGSQLGGVVAMVPATGQILAVAGLGLDGLQPPGSTFKIITAGAAIERDMATPNTLLGCPGTIDIGHRTIPNYGGFDLGTVPMSRAFANSCNTTFAQLASQMPPRGLTQAAEQYGIGPDYKIDGISTVSGSVPPTVNLTERTEDGFGQGKVLVSPFGMALAAATVAAGKTPVPQLIEGRQTVITGDSSPITPKMLDGLRPMMRLVVTNGTAKDLNGSGDVSGKTGEAEFNGGSHAWFAGYRGDMAFAALIVGGGSSEYAVRMLKGMLAQLPPDYLA